MDWGFGRIGMNMNRIEKLCSNCKYSNRRCSGVGPVFMYNCRDYCKFSLNLLLCSDLNLRGDCEYFSPKLWVRFSKFIRNIISRKIGMRL